MTTQHSSQQELSTSSPGSLALQGSSPLGWRLLQLRICIVVGNRTSQVLVGVGRSGTVWGLTGTRIAQVEAQSMSSTHSDTSCSRSAVKVEVSVQEGGETTLRRKRPPYAWYLGLLPPLPWFQNQTNIQQKMKRRKL